MSRVSENSNRLAGSQRPAPVCARSSACACAQSDLSRAHRPDFNLFSSFPTFFFHQSPNPPVWHHPQSKSRQSQSPSQRYHHRPSGFPRIIRGVNQVAIYISYCLPLYLDWPSTWNGPCISSPTLSHDHLHSRLSLFVPT